MYSCKLESALPYYKFTPNQQEAFMAKRKLNYQLADDDLDSMEVIENDGMSREVIIEKYMEDISEILSQAYSDIDSKVRELVDALDNR